MQRLAFGLVLGCVAWTGACGGDAVPVHGTVASIEPVRGRTRIDGDDAPGHARAAADSAIALERDALVRVGLDGGARLLVAGEATLRTEGDAAIRVDEGRLFAEVPDGTVLSVATPEGTLRVSDGSVSLDRGRGRTSVYVVRGEVAYRAGRGARGLAHAGERLVLSNGRGDVSPESLFEDWTGGLAEPGPRGEGSEGVGVLEGRVPGNEGVARWPLVIRDLRVRVHVEGDLAITDVEEVFFNPASETVEGLYRIRVPAGAVLHRFAVDRNGQLVEGYVREKQQAAAAYQAQVYQGSTLDPALLEWQAEGRYQARIYPIAPGASRRIAVRYSEWLERPAANAPRTYRYPIGGGDAAPDVEELSFEADFEAAGATSIRASHGAEVDGAHVLLRRSDVKPRTDIVIELGGGASTQQAYRADHVAPRRDPRAGPAPAEQESDYFFVPLVVLPPGANTVAARGLDLVVVADLSAGTDRSHLELGRTAIEAITSQLRPEDRIAIVAGDLAVRPLGGGTPALASAEPARITGLLDALSRMPAGGATDLGAMLADAASMLDPARPGAVLYVGDGAPTVGELGAGPLLERLGRLPAPLRAYAVAVGDDANLDLLETVTHGGGLATRVTTRAEAGDAALAILAHLARPVVQRVEVSLGAGIEGVYPRGPSAVVLGDVLPIVGRVRGDVPSTIVVKGTFAGRRFEQHVSVHTNAIRDEGDLRLRWASARLSQLLLAGARRAEVADLGTRFGIITPFTSFYVPSAAELSDLGPRARELLLEGRLASAPRVRVDASYDFLAWPAAAAFSLFGCTNASPEPSSAPSATVAPSEPPMAHDEEGQMARAAREEPANRYAIQGGEAERAQAAPGAPADAPAPPPPIVAAPTTPSPEPAPSAAPSGGANSAPAQTAASAGILQVLEGAAAADDGAAHGASSRTTAEDASRDVLGALGYATNQQPPATGDSTTRGYGGLGLRGTGTGGGGSEQREGGHGTRHRAARPRTDEDAFGLAEDRRIVAFVSVPDPHAVRRCSDAAGLVLEARTVLFRERLARTTFPNEWVSVYERAIAACEAPTWRDRRALLDLVLARAGDVPTMISAYQAFATPGARLYLRRAILARVRTPDDLRAARAAFGTSLADHALIESELARATDDAGRIRVLRTLVARFGGDLDLALRLLSLLEGEGRKDEARRLAERMRGDALADAGIRTAIGEMYLRFGDEAEARRAFSEIVEFAPNDELARRRLGDLYRAHGWFEDAYRQYQTLASIRPDDLGVLLLLAQAAAGSGRIDEALRLEQRLAETASPGGAEGMARTAILWSSVRLAELRKGAREAHDDERVRRYLSAMRRGGVLREASPLRVTLVWAHPDADLSLWAAHPGLSLTRPTDIAPEYGLEAFDVREVEDGTYRVEVRRGTRDRLPSVDAKLVVTFREGQRDERIEVLPLHFGSDERARAFTITGDVVASAVASEGGR